MRLVQFFRPYLIYLILLFATAALLYHIDKPFIGHHDWNGAFWGSDARANADYFHRKFGIGINVETDFIHKGTFAYNSDYTPFMSLLFTFSTLLFGVHEWNLRIVTVCLSLMLVYFTYKIGKELISINVGLIAALFTVITPMFLYFGKLPDHEPLVTSLITTAVYFFLVQKKKNFRHTLVFYFFMTLALVESWSAYFWLPFLWLYKRLTKQKAIQLWPVFLVSILIVSIHLIFLNHFIGVRGLQNFLGSGISRLNIRSATTEIINFSLKQFVVTEAHFAVIYFTRILLGFAAIWWFIMILFRKNQLSRSTASGILLLGLPALSFLIVFNQLAYIHDYKLYLLLPMVTLSAAACVNVIINKLSPLLQMKFSSLQTTWVTGILFGLLVSLLFIERLPYLSTLLATNFNTPGYELGLIIKNNTSVNEATYIDSGQFYAFYDVFINYYANRHTFGGDLHMDANQKLPARLADYRYVVLIKGRLVDAEIENFLTQQFKSETYGDYTLVDTQSYL
jgi:4-amino-4-deoxy-L-arabinose transferase-like glycosyltransferase